MTTEETTSRCSASARLKGWVSSVLANFKQRQCSHRFALEDLKMINPDSPGTDRVEWPCDKCGEVFTAQCGLDIAPENGPLYRRGSETPN